MLGRRGKSLSATIGGEPGYVCAGTDTRRGVRAGDGRAESQIVRQLSPFNVLAGGCGRGCSRTERVFGAVSEEADGAREPAMRMTSGRARGPPGFRSGEARKDLERLIVGGGENLAARSDTLPCVG